IEAEVRRRHAHVDDRVPHDPPEGREEWVGIEQVRRRAGPDRTLAPRCHWGGVRKWSTTASWSARPIPCLRQDGSTITYEIAPLSSNAIAPTSLSGVSNT